MMPRCMLWNADGWIHVPWSSGCGHTPWADQDSLQRSSRHWVLWLKEVTRELREATR